MNATAIRQQRRLIGVLSDAPIVSLAGFTSWIRISGRASEGLCHLAQVLLGVVVMAAAAQVSVHVPGTPVPVSGQTFGVLVVSGALGFRRGTASVALYVILGFLLPIYAGGASGVGRIVTDQDGRLVLGATGGYLVGFLVAAAAVGRLSELGWARRYIRALAAMLVGNALIYLVGLPWLATAIGLTPDMAIRQGFLPFVVGDALKFALAAAVFPLGWWIVERPRPKR